MRVTLAFAVAPHGAAGETVDLPDSLGRSLITSGWARPAEGNGPLTIPAPVAIDNEEADDGR